MIKLFQNKLAILSISIGVGVSSVSIAETVHIEKSSTVTLSLLTEKFF